MSFLQSVSLGRVAAPASFAEMAEMAPKRADRSSLDYLRGPIDWPGLRKAICAGAGALPVALALWHLRALKDATSFPASHRTIRRITGLTEKVVREGLRRLRNSGLIEVQERPGMNSLYTLLDWAARS